MSEQEVRCNDCGYLVGIYTGRGHNVLCVDLRQARQDHSEAEAYAKELEIRLADKDASIAQLIEQLQKAEAQNAALESALGHCRDLDEEHPDCMACVEMAKSSRALIERASSVSSIAAIAYLREQLPGLDDPAESLSPDGYAYAAFAAEIIREALALLEPENANTPARTEAGGAK